jgi:peptidoglycan hydrolase CwlO-like protein
MAELRGQLNDVKEYIPWKEVNHRKQASLKSGKSGIQNQLDAIKAKIEREQNELKVKKGKINYRNTDEIDREIK